MQGCIAMTENTTGFVPIKMTCDSVLFEELLDAMKRRQVSWDFVGFFVCLDCGMTKPVPGTPGVACRLCVGNRFARLVQPLEEVVWAALRLGGYPAAQEVLNGQVPVFR